MSEPTIQVSQNLSNLLSDLESNNQTLQKNLLVCIKYLDSKIKKCIDTQADLEGFSMTLAELSNVLSTITQEVIMDIWLYRERQETVRKIKQACSPLLTMNQGTK